MNLRRLSRALRTVHPPSHSPSARLVPSRGVGGPTVLASSPKDRAGGAASPPGRYVFEMRDTRPRFRRGLCPAPPVAPNGPATALQRARPTLRRLLLARLSRTAAFESRGRPPPAPVTTPAAAALPRLVMDVARSVTSLAGVTRGPHTVCPGPPPGHSFHRQVISPGRN
jgi:hypothetical protein